MNCYEYKGYVGSAEVDVGSASLVGKLLFIRDTIAYSAPSVAELEGAFREAVDDYLETCAELGHEPDVPFKGSFNVRVDPALHRQAAIEARRAGINLNQFVTQALQGACHGKAAQHNHFTVQLQQTPDTRIVSPEAPLHWETPLGYPAH